MRVKRGNNRNNQLILCNHLKLVLVDSSSWEWEGFAYCSSDRAWGVVVQHIVPQNAKCANSDRLRHPVNVRQDEFLLKRRMDMDGAGSGTKSGTHYG